MAEQVIAQPAKNDEAYICKRCGFDQREEFIKVNQDDLEAYFKSALAQIPFAKTYKWYGGLLELTFEEATGRLLRLQERAIMSLTQGTGSISDAADYSMLSSLTEIRQVPKEGSARVLYTADRARREQLLEKQEIPTELLDMPMIQLQSLRNSYTIFARHCAALMNAAQDENFWEGVGRN